MRLPIAQAGALMPDAHLGYGLPVGGVLATENSVIPYGLGVDIGCRMYMTIYDISASVIDSRKQDLKEILIKNTKFGRETFKKIQDHEVLANSLFNEIAVLRSLKDRAARQMGTSGGGNHFVEIGVTEIETEDSRLGLPRGKYLAILSHSGSRGLGAGIAKYYTYMAMEQCQLPYKAKNLAWLGLDTELGEEYWLAMNLAGAYAVACHHQIHGRIAASLRATPVTMIENHHNFAWKEQDGHGNMVIVHRKGAIPAGKGVLGVIPGSMTAAGYIVRGKGNAASLNSAAHGAGRIMSRTQARRTLNKQATTAYINSTGVEVIGSGLDEAPMVYKDIQQVMASQKSLVEVIGSFQPKVVRMCNDKKSRETD